MGGGWEGLRHPRSPPSSLWLEGLETEADRLAGVLRGSERLSVLPKVTSSRRSAAGPGSDWLPGRWTPRLFTKEEKTSGFQVEHRDPESAHSLGVRVGGAAQLLCGSRAHLPAPDCLLWPLRVAGEEVGQLCHPGTKGRLCPAATSSIPLQGGQNLRSFTSPVWLCLEKGPPGVEGKPV